MDNTFFSKIKKHCKDKNNYLCIGLDLASHISDIDEHDKINFIRDLSADIIESTIEYCPFYKINFAFFESLGWKGYKLIEEIVQIINNRAITIADAKRSDIANSSKYYARSIFDNLKFDSITVSPYMGYDSIEPFLSYKNKGVFVLCLTSNPGASDFQSLKINNDDLSSLVASVFVKKNKFKNIGFVVGATKENMMNKLRQITPHTPWLIPGVGAQGGNLEASMSIGFKNGGIPIINVSRSIIYAGNGSIKDIKDSAMNYTKMIRSVIDRL